MTEPTPDELLLGADPTEEWVADAWAARPAIPEALDISAHDRAWFIAQAEAATDDEQRLWLRPSEVLALARPAVPEALDVERLALAMGRVIDTDDITLLRSDASLIAREYAALRSKEPTE